MSLIRPLKRSTHAVGLRVTRLDEPMLGAQQRTLAVEGVLTRGPFIPRGEAVGELAAIVCQHFLICMGAVAQKGEVLLENSPALIKCSLIKIQACF